MRQREAWMIPGVERQGKVAHIPWRRSNAMHQRTRCDMMRIEGANYGREK